MSPQKCPADVAENDLLNSVAANKLIGNILEYVDSTMQTDLYKLECIIVLNAFLLKNKPIIDIFYTYDDYGNRVLRKPKDFYRIMGASGFVAHFYKVSFLCIYLTLTISLLFVHSWFI